MVALLGRSIKWVKSNKLLAFLICLVLFLGYCEIYRSSTGYQYGGETSSLGELVPSSGSEEAAYSGDSSGTSTSQTASKKIITTSTISLVVDDVQGVADTIVSYAEGEDGYMVSTSISQLEDDMSATVIIRVPAAKLKTATEYLRSLASKVSSESLSGRDVSSTYADYQARITTLEATIARLETIMDSATEASDMVSIASQILSLQESVDAYKGYMQAIDEASDYAKITAYLATDELSLPYEPPTGFRPTVVFKQAVRALLTDLYAAASALIRVGVYGAIWVPTLFLIFLIRFMIRRKRQQSR
jgi:hypothetical protein